MNSNEKNEQLILKIINSLPSDLSESQADFLNSLPHNIVIDVLVRIMLEDSNSMIRSRAFDGVLKLKKLDKVKFLIDLYDNYESEWGNVCCQEFVRFKNDPRVSKKLCNIALNSEDSDIRFNAIESLWKIGNISCLPTLKHIIKHDDGIDYEGRPIKQFAQKVLNDLNPC